MSSQVRIADLSFKLEKQPTLRRNRALLAVSHSEQVVVQKLNMIDAAGQGIRIDACRGVQVEHCDVNNAGTIGIELVASRQVDVSLNTITSSRDIGIICAYNGSIHRMSQYLKIHDNTVSKTYSGFGIAITSGDHVVVESNRIADTYQAGLALYQFSGWFPPKQLTFRDNVLVDCNQGGSAWTRGSIHISGIRADALTFIGNKVTGNQIALWLDRNRIKQLTIKKNQFKTGDAQPVYISDKQRPNIAEFIMD